MSEKYILGTLTILILGLAVLRPQSAFTLRQFLEERGEAGGAEAELTALKAEVARGTLVREQEASSISRGKTAEVYSEYPFGMKNEFLVNIGGRDGVKAGQPALFHGVFVGRVSKVFPQAALVETLFDTRTKYPVRVGVKGVDALLVGGNEPRLTLISNDAVLDPGEAIYLAAPSLPYGLGVGDTGQTQPTRDGLFKETQVHMPYNPGEIRVVQIPTDWDPSHQ